MQTMCVGDKYILKYFCDIYTVAVNFGYTIINYLIISNIIDAAIDIIIRVIIIIIIIDNQNFNVNIINLTILLLYYL